MQRLGQKHNAAFWKHDRPTEDMKAVADQMQETNSC